MAVGITLEAIAAPGATPLANNGSSAKSFANDYFKSAVGSLTTRQRLALIIVAMTHTETAVNYKSNHAGLIQDAKVYTGGISQFDYWTAAVGLEWTNGHAVDGTLSADVPTLLKEGRDLENLAEDQLFRIIALLRAQLNT